MAGWQRFIRRPPCPEDDDDDCDDDDDDNHRGAVETNAGESDGADCYLSLFANITIWCVVAAMV